jgi:acyl-CoA thioesterase
MSELSRLLEVLELDPTGPGTFRAQNFAEGAVSVVFGGQILAQTIVAATSADPTKAVKSVHTVFARGADGSMPLDIEVDAMHGGRALSSATVTIRQGERICTRSLALLSAARPHPARHDGTRGRDTGRGHTHRRLRELLGHQGGGRCRCV